MKAFLHGARLYCLHQLLAHTFAPPSARDVDGKVCDRGICATMSIRVQCCPADHHRVCQGDNNIVTRLSLEKPLLYVLGVFSIRFKRSSAILDTFIINSRDRTKISGRRISYDGFGRSHSGRDYARALAISVNERS